MASERSIGALSPLANLNPSFAGASRPWGSARHLGAFPPFRDPRMLFVMAADLRSASAGNSRVFERWENSRSGGVHRFISNFLG